MRRCLWMAWLVWIATVAIARASTGTDALANLPVLDNGRVKPVDTLARETVRFVTNREAVDADPAGRGTTRFEPLSLLLAWHADPAYWGKQPLVYVPNLQLRGRLRMNPGDKYVAPDTLAADGDFAAWSRELSGRHAAAEQAGEVTHFTRLEDAAVDVARRLSLYQAAVTQKLVGVVSTGDTEDAWISPADLANKPNLPTELAGVRDAWAAVGDAYAGDNQVRFDQAVATLREKVVAAAPATAASSVNQARVDREVAYNRLKPFRTVWVAYLLVVVALTASLLVRRPAVYVVAMGALIAAIGVHVAAFAFRCSITGWAPVTNIYETVIWVSLTAAVFATALELVYRRRTLAIGGAVTALITSVIADVMPPEYGHQLRNLTPVLRSNYWLIIHVLTIVSSYAAFALACVLGNIVLGQMMLRRRPAAAIRDNLQFTYRAVQIGVLLVAAGTILGGLWADVSWGRFWGWDPKEVWALIILLTYLALLHGRFAGWVGPFGLAAGSVLCFCTVIMSWYGVNFILGVGLHAYGFGAGGGAYIGSYVVAQILYVAVAKWIHSKRLRESAAKPTAGDVPMSGIAPAGAH